MLDSLTSLFSASATVISSLCLSWYPFLTAHVMTLLFQKYFKLTRWHIWALQWYCLIWQLCTKLRAVFTGWSTVSGFDRTWYTSLSSNRLCVLDLHRAVYNYNGAQRYEQFLQVGRLYRALILLGLARFQAPLCLQSLWCYIDIKFFCLHPSLYLLVSWAWWDWPWTWLTNHRPSVLWRCWLGHVARKIVSKMTYNVSSGTLNPTIPYLLVAACFTAPAAVG